MFFTKVFVNALFIATQIQFSTTYQYKRSLLVAILYTTYVYIIFPHVTYGFIYVFLLIMLWLLFSASYFQRTHLFDSYKSRTESKWFCTTFYFYFTELIVLYPPARYKYLYLVHSLPGWIRHPKPWSHLH